MANSIELSGYVNNVKKVSDNLTVFSLAVGTNVGTKEEPEWKNGFVNCKIGGKTDSSAIEDGKRVDIKGFVTFDFFTPKGSDKEVASLQVFVTEATPA